MTATLTATTATTAAPQTARDAGLADELMPTYDRAIRSSTTVALSRPEVDTLLHWVAPADMPFFGSLMAVRSLGRSRQDREVPVLELLEEYEGLHQEEVPGHEIVTAAMTPFWNLRAPDVAFPGREQFLVRQQWCAKLLASYRFDDAEDGTRITIEIRVTDTAERAAARKFRWYWRLAGRWGAAVFGRALLRAARRHTRHTG